ncbi:hypothetical protein [Paenibacillus periandrae]|uniref:hypothetical protein n=1 Tax=Paenibacillus periandrae TaxID=1761741 RepID=UPI001F08E967|nr:hypothetical protein [Paenibacillus periandrae]
MKRDEVNELKESAAPTFSKQQLIEAKRYTAQQKDLLNALLDDGQAYTQAQVDGLIGEFLGRVEG